MIVAIDLDKDTYRMSRFKGCAVFLLEGLESLEEGGERRGMLNRDMKLGGARVLQLEECGNFRQAKRHTIKDVGEAHIALCKEPYLCNRRSHDAGAATCTSGRRAPSRDRTELPEA